MTKFCFIFTNEKLHFLFNLALDGLTLFHAVSAKDFYPSSNEGNLICYLFTKSTTLCNDCYVASAKRCPERALPVYQVREVIKVKKESLL